MFFFGKKPPAFTQQAREEFLGKISAAVSDDQTGWNTGQILSKYSQQETDFLIFKSVISRVCRQLSHT
jgi:hypothetical protein